MNRILRLDPPARLLLAGTLTIALAAVALPDRAGSRVAVAVLLGGVLLGVAWWDRALGILATTAYLATLGLDRRLVSMVLPDPSDDPLLLVAPVVVAGLALLAVRDGAGQRPAAVTVAVAVGFGLTVIAVANPISSVAANAKGALFWSVPLLWFVIGRALPAPDLLDRLLRLVTWLGLGACATGTLQATVGFPAWDHRWIDNRGYEALGVNSLDTIRPFGWSSSAGEFALTAAMVVVLCALRLAAAARGRSWAAVAGWAGGLAVAMGALGLSGVRTAVVLALIGLVVVAIAASGTRLPQVVLLLSVAAVLLVGGVRLLDVESWDGNGVAGLARRSLIGITDPFGAESTLQSHVDLTEVGFRTLDDRPLGGGPAYGTTAAEQHDGVLVSAENDLGNAALAFGLPGVAMVVTVTALGLWAAWRAARVEPVVITLACLGILVVSLRFWWNGGQYATAALTWLCLGWTDRARR